MLTPVVIRCVFRSQFDQKFAMLNAARELTAPPSPLAGLRANGKEGRGERRRDGMKEKRRKGRRGKGTLCPSFNS